MDGDPPRGTEKDKGIPLFPKYGYGGDFFPLNGNDGDAWRMLMGQTDFQLLRSFRFRDLLRQSDDPLTETLMGFPGGSSDKIYLFLHLRWDHFLIFRILKVEFFLRNMPSERTITGGKMVLLTGGSGFLGRAIVHEILKDDSPVQVGELRVFDLSPLTIQEH